MKKDILYDIFAYLYIGALIIGSTLMAANAYGSIGETDPDEVKIEAVEPIVKEIVEEVETEDIFEGESSVVSYSSCVSDIPEEPVEEEIVEPVESFESEVVYFDVPLSEDLQDHIFEVCESYGVDPAVIIAMIGKESTYRADTIGDNGNSYGLMQIQPRWHQARIDRLGVTDLLDPYQNVVVGINYFAELLGYGQGLEWSLMAYNGGISYANKKTAAGEVSDYARIVLANASK